MFGPGEAPGAENLEGFLFQPHRGQRERRPRSSEPVLKVKWLRVPELVLLAGNNALLLAHLPLHCPGLGKGGGEAELLFSSSALGGPFPGGTASGWKSREDPA